jgi:hypothetical protein
MTRVLRIVALAPCVSAISSPPALGLSVSGNHLVDDSGGPIRLLGVSRRSIRAMKRWGINAVRLPLNPDGWDTKGGWTCHAGPSLIQDYRGRPTGFGIGFRNHLLKIRRHARG